MKALLAAGLAMAWTAAPAAAVEFFKVIDVSGTAEIQTAGGDRWQPLRAPRLLAGKDKVRVPEKSYVEFASDRALGGLFLLAGGSELEVMGDDRTRFFLRQGGISVLRERDDVSAAAAGEEPVLQIFTRDMIVSVRQGGFSVASYAGGSQLRVFGEEAGVEELDSRGGAGRTRTVGEGFKFTRLASSKKRQAEPARMEFADYENWLRWMRKCYKRKDDRTQAGLLKG